MECELMFWSESDPPTCTLKFHTQGRDTLVTFQVEALQVNELGPDGKIRSMTTHVKEGRVE